MKKLFYLSIILFCAAFAFNCASDAASAQEYFSIGMAYFELGKYEEAEMWLNRARSANRTMIASHYNLGRLAYERQRYEEAVVYFEDILKIDPDNVLALQAAAYTRIKTGDIDIAEKHYSRLLELVPENADDGYNHALVLYAMERYSEAEEVLKKYHVPLQENNELQFLYARCQAAQNKIEAIETFSVLLNNNPDAKVRFEYAKTLEQHELYARAIEEYKKAISDTADDNVHQRGNIRFYLAKTLLIADSGSGDGITEMNTAVKEGFNDIKAIEELLHNTKISAANRESLGNIINDMRP